MISFRPTTEADAEFLWALRIDQEIADTWWSPVPADKEKWLAATLLATHKWRPYIVVFGGVQLGRVAFQDTPWGWEFSIGLTKQFRNRGFGPKIIRQGFEFASARGWLPFVATIKPDNIRSQKAFQKCGFEKKELWVCTLNPPATGS